jgi:hypothetical protein
MEYTFKNSLAGKACTILLTEYHLSIQSAGKSEIIPYANISAIRLFKAGSKVFKLFVYFEKSKPVLITNMYYLSPSEVEDRSRQYSTFVRVLHMHLETKAGASYTTGFSVNNLIGWGVTIVITAFAIAFTTHHFATGFFNPFLLAGGLIIAALTVFVAAKTKWPRYYHPLDIPLNFLP